MGEIQASTEQGKSVCSPVKNISKIEIKASSSEPKCQTEKGTYIYHFSITMFLSSYLFAKNSSMIYIIINNLFAGVSSGTSNGVRQALSSLPSSPRKEIQGLQVKLDLPDGQRPTGSLDIQHLKQKIHDIPQTEETSDSKMSQNGNVKQPSNQVPPSASNSTHSSSTSLFLYDGIFFV